MARTAFDRTLVMHAWIPLATAGMRLLGLGLVRISLSRGSGTRIRDAAIPE